MRLGEIQRTLIVDLANQFEASGIEYACGAVVIDFALRSITDQNVQETKLPATRIARRVWDEVHRRTQT